MKIYRGVLVVGAIVLSMQASAARYIVKFNRDSDLNLAKAQIAQKSNNNGLSSMGFLAHMRAPGFEVSGVRAMAAESLDALGFLSVDLATPGDIARLAQDPKVAYIEPEFSMEIPEFDPLAQEESEITWGLEAVDATGAWEQGVTGNGSRVLVIDTGIDRDHPDLAANFEKGRDFTGRDIGSQLVIGGGLQSDLFDEIVQEGEEVAEYDYFDEIGHGTHVAGTIAAGLNGFGVAGVAPEAKILAARVCGRLGCSSIAILRGMNWAIEEDVDVVNMSLGGPVPSRSHQEAAEDVEAAGVVIVAASGNDAEFEQNRIAFPAGYPTVFSVGALTPDIERANFSQYGPNLDITAPGVEVESSVPVGSGRKSVVTISHMGEDLNVRSTSFVGSEENEEPVDALLVPAGLGYEDDFIAEGGYEGKIALISRGEIAFADKVTNAIAAGAAGVVIYNNVPGLISGSLTTDGSSVGIPVALVEQHVGENIVEAIGAGEAVSAAVSVAKTDYAGFAGTSMASPHVAGVAALILSANPNLSPAQVRQMLRDTSILIENPTADNEYGAGITNARLAAGAALSALAAAAKK